MEKRKSRVTLLPLWDRVIGTLTGSGLLWARARLRSASPHMARLVMWTARSPDCNLQAYMDCKVVQASLHCITTILQTLDRSRIPLMLHLFDVFSLTSGPPRFFSVVMFFEKAPRGTGRFTPPPVRLLPPNDGD